MLQSGPRRKFTDFISFLREMFSLYSLAPLADCLRKLDMLVIDEISQADQCMWGCVTTAIAELPCTPFLVWCGDTQQSQPMEGGRSSPASAEAASLHLSQAFFAGCILEHLLEGISAWALGA